MNLDLSFLQPLLAGLSPGAAVAVGVVMLIVQHVAAKQGANPTLGGLLGFLGGLFGKPSVAPAADPEPPKTVVPATKPADPLANRPVLKGLRDILASLAVQKLTSQLVAAPDDHDAALATYQRVAAAISPTPPLR